MARFNIGAKPVVEVLLRMTLGENVDYRTAFNEVFFKHMENADLLSVDSDGSGKLELVYSVTLRKNTVEQAMLSDLRTIDDSVQAQLIHGHSSINL